MLSVAPFVSSGTAILVTPIVSLLTRQKKTAETELIWTSFHTSRDEDGDSFTLIPKSIADRTGLVLIGTGFLSFLGGVIFASVIGSVAASTLAVGGMLFLFAGGIVRV